jgi:hypothetical protein
MIVHLDQNEIHTALIEYISNQGYPVAGKKVEVCLTAGRGARGYSAQLTFETINTSSPATTGSAPSADSDDEQQAILFEFERHKEED